MKKTHEDVLYTKFKTWYVNKKNIWSSFKIFNGDFFC